MKRSETGSDGDVAPLLPKTRHKTSSNTRKKARRLPRDVKASPVHGAPVRVAPPRRTGETRSFVVKGHFDEITGLSTITEAPVRGIKPATLKPGRKAPDQAVDVVVTGKHSFRLKPSALKQLRRYSDEEIYSLVVPKRTLARRVAEREPLTVEETDKAVRLARVDELAARIFGDAAKAHRWLRKPKASLGGAPPLAYLATEAGARVVEEMLNQIDHGILA
jgi:putative toxin-antitoxin system antitoxin component (TIGR02293 family)